MPKPYPDQLVPKLNILVVDDEPLIRQVLVELLSLDGHRVVAAANSTQALIAIRRRHYDAVFADVCMPRIDGLELAARIREKYPDMFIVAMSGRFKSPVLHDPRWRAVDTFLGKPFSVRELAQVLDTISSSCRSLQMLTTPA